MAAQHSIHRRVPPYALPFLSVQAVAICVSAVLFVRLIVHVYGSVASAFLRFMTGATQ
jgi:hypothetical protein